VCSWERDGDVEVALWLAVGDEALIGTLATTLYATARNWPAATRVQDSLAATALAVALGALAGLYPAAKAARLSPSGSLRAV
jgi:putative ABC transport system permease protein